MISFVGTNIRNGPSSVRSAATARRPFSAMGWRIVVSGGVINFAEQLRSHLVRARANGLSQEELIETITHLAFYAGWPNAVTAISVAKEVFEKK